MKTAEHLQKIKAKCQELLAIADGPILAKDQPCGCRVCICEDPDQCHGCGAANCGTHPIGHIPNSVYSPDCAGPAKAGWRTTIAAIDDLLGIFTDASGFADGATTASAHNKLTNEFEGIARNSINRLIATWPEEML